MMHKSDAVGVLQSSPLFAGLTGDEFNEISELMEQRSVEYGENVFCEGDEGEDMFILLSGSLQAHRSQSDGIQYWMFDIVPGTFLGEMSVIAGEPRSATISAKEDSDLMVLPGKDFYKIVFEKPALGIKLLNAIATVQNEWLDQTANHLKDLVTWGETARRRAITDDLTGLYNRSFLEESINDKFEAGNMGMRKMSLLMMDLDRVHEINDAYGIQAGDKVFIAVAEVLKTTLRTGDIAARLSGDEFAILLPDTGGQGALRVAEHIRQNVMEKSVKVLKDPSGNSEETTELEIRTSLGIAVAPVNAVTTNDLFLAADNALRKAKGLGRNRAELAPQSL